MMHGQENIKSSNVIKFFCTHRADNRNH